MKLYRCSKMEPTILRLDQDFDKVLVRSTHHRFLKRPIRLRPKLLEAARPFIVRNNPAFDKQFDDWNDEFGTLINYRAYDKRERKLEYDACFLCEAPLSRFEIDGMTQGARSACVIYRPSSWRKHQELIDIIYPSSEACQQFYTALHTVKPTLELVSIAQACGIPTSGTYAASDNDMCNLLNASPPLLQHMRQRMIKSRYGQRGAKPYAVVRQLIPRIEPADKALLEMYRFIKNEVPALGHLRLVKDSGLSKCMRFWKIALRALVRDGNIEHKGETHFYFMPELKPDFDAIQQEHDGALKRFNLLTELLDGLEDYPLSQPIAAPESPECAAHSPDTAG